MGLLSSFCGGEPEQEEEVQRPDTRRRKEKSSLSEKAFFLQKGKLASSFLRARRAEFFFRL